MSTFLLGPPSGFLITLYQTLRHLISTLIITMFLPQNFVSSTAYTLISRNTVVYPDRVVWKVSMLKGNKSNITVPKVCQNTILHSQKEHCNVLKVGMVSVLLSVLFGHTKECSREMICLVWSVWPFSTILLYTGMVSI